VKFAFCYLTIDVFLLLLAAASYFVCVGLHMAMVAYISSPTQHCFISAVYTIDQNLLMKIPKLCCLSAPNVKYLRTFLENPLLSSGIYKKVKAQCPTVCTEWERMDAKRRFTLLE
jgi:hypothetical protein